MTLHITRKNYTRKSDASTVSARKNCSAMDIAEQYLLKISNCIIYSGWKCHNQPEHIELEEVSRSGLDCGT